MKELNFKSPTFFERLRGMLGVDFYRLFHTPMFYIFLGIAAVIPAMILGTMGMENPQTGEVAKALYENTFHLIASPTNKLAFSDISEYANMNMVFIFGGIMVSLFIGSDYRSGYVKQLFTTHAKKQDYMISKTLSCAFSMACMCITYTIGGVVGGLFAGASFEVSPLHLICAILGKIAMSLGWAGLYTFINVILRKFFAISIGLSFFFGTGILIIGAGAIVEMLGIPSVLLNAFLYGSSVFACLHTGTAFYVPMLALLLCLVISVSWAVIYILVGTKILSKSDVY